MFEYISKISRLEEIKHTNLGSIDNFNSFEKLEQLSKQQGLDNPKIVASLKSKESNPLVELIYQINRKEDFKWVKDIGDSNLCLFRPNIYIIDGDKYIA